MSFPTTSEGHHFILSANQKRNLLKLSSLSEILYEFACLSAFAYADRSTLTSGFGFLPQIPVHLSVKLSETCSVAHCCMDAS